MRMVNDLIMVLMAVLALWELYQMHQHGVTPIGVVFFLLFSAFAVRRFLIRQRTV